MRAPKASDEVMSAAVKVYEDVQVVQQEMNDATRDENEAYSALNSDYWDLGRNPPSEKEVSDLEKQLT